MIYTDADYDEYKYSVCKQCEHYNICKIFSMDKIDECMEGTELAELEQEQKDKRVC